MSAFTKRPVVVIFATQCVHLRPLFERFSKTFASLHFATTQGTFEIVADVNASLPPDSNVVLVGAAPCFAPSVSFIAAAAPFVADMDSITISGCTLTSRNRAVLSLLPLRVGECVKGVGIMASFWDADGAASATAVLLPTIPPMARDPLSNLMPDIIVTSPQFSSGGVGETDVFGFFDSHWVLDPSMSSIRFDRCT
jgi:hypothetical protein